MIAPGEYARLSNVDSWKCFFCKKKQDEGLICRRVNWKNSLQELFSDSDESTIYVSEVFS